MSTLVMVSGAGLGMGKTTLSRGLARELRGDLYEAEALIFERPEFEEVAGCFRRKDHPSALQLESAFGRLVETVLLSGATDVMEHSFIDGAEDLRWAVSSEESLHEHSRRMRDVMRPVGPVTIFLDGDLAVGMRRREMERGREWFLGYDQPGPNETWGATLSRIQRRFEARRERILAALDAGGWPVNVLDGTRPQQEVLDAALEVVARHVS